MSSFGDLMAGPPPTHLPPDPAAGDLAGGTAPRDVVRAHPASPVAWAALASEAVSQDADAVTVYAYAREDLDAWRPTLGDLRAGAFGENLTTRGLEVTHARIGERWRVGADLVLEVAVPRIPCRTFAAWLEVQGWVKTFTRTAVPGAYLRVVREGAVRAGDPVVVEEAWARWREEVAFADEYLARTEDLGTTGPKGDVLREVLLHMVEEYARHCGHADLLRECIDGRTGQ